MAVPVGGEGLHQFAFGLGDVLHAAELPRVGGAHAQDDADVRLDHVGEVADVPDAGGTHFDDQVPGAGVGPEDGERHADLAVVGTLRRNGGALRRRGYRRGGPWWWSCRPNR